MGKLDAIEAKKEFLSLPSMLQKRKTVEIYFCLQQHKSSALLAYIWNSKVFSGLGKLKGEKIKLDIDETNTPRAQPQRRVPYHIWEKITSAITELESQDIIEKVPENKATPRVSPIVAIPKKMDRSA